MINDRLYGIIREAVKSSRFSKRSNKWPKIRKYHLKEHPQCVVCGKTHSLDVHHIVPFHVDPGKELDLNNLITLCKDHHLLFGHLGWWKSWNEDVVEDTWHWRKKIMSRPR